MNKAEFVSTSYPSFFVHAAYTQSLLYPYRRHAHDCIGSKQETTKNYRSKQLLERTSRTVLTKPTMRSRSYSQNYSRSYYEGY
jgi:hypothetical protein